MKRKTVAIRASIVLGCLIVVVGVFYSWTFFHYNLKLVRISPTVVDTQLHQLEALNRNIQEGKIPSRREDFRSVGSPAREAKLLDFRHWIQVYEASFGSPPVHSSDLKRMIAEGTLRASQKNLVAKYSNECQMVVLEGESYLLNCDGAALQDSKQIGAMIKQFDEGSERFYLLEGHTYLYAPPLRTRPDTQMDRKP